MLNMSMVSSSSQSSTNKLRASHQILLSKFIRQVKEYSDNVEDQSNEQIHKIKSKLIEIASKQNITLFDEEE
jgi:hypothetical protein